MLLVMHVLVTFLEMVAMENLKLGRCSMSRIRPRAPFYKMLSKAG